MRNIHSVRIILTNDEVSQLILALVTVCIDHCKSLLYGLPHQSLDRLEIILNTATRILCRIPKYEHISKNTDGPALALCLTTSSI